MLLSAGVTAVVGVGTWLCALSSDQYVGQWSSQNTSSCFKVFDLSTQLCFRHVYAGSIHYCFVLNKYTAFKIESKKIKNRE